MGGVVVKGDGMTDKEYRTIKSLVVDYVRRCNGVVDYDGLTTEVRRHFPDSRWQRTHWAWYRTQIVRGKYRQFFSDEIRRAVSGGKPIPAGAGTAPADPSGPGARGRPPRDPEIKRLGDRILAHARRMLEESSDGDDVKHFKLNRWVFGRLQWDEIRAKRPIKKALWDAGMQICQACRQPFSSLKNVEIHRKDGSLPYAIENCELLCRDCHRELGR